MRKSEVYSARKSIMQPRTREFIEKEEINSFFLKLSFKDQKVSRTKQSAVARCAVFNGWQGFSGPW